MAKKTTKSENTASGDNHLEMKMSVFNLYEEQLFVDILNEAEEKGMKPLVIDEDLCRAHVIIPMIWACSIILSMLPMIEIWLVIDLNLL